jgi:putative phosphoesterase
VTTIGLISDTHGLLRPGIATIFTGVSRILHAGDVGGPSILAALAAIAPVEAVAGNVDDPCDPMLAVERTMAIGGLTLHLSHGHELGSPTAEKLFAKYTADVLVFGHTHQAVVVRDGSARLAVNPGAAGPRRFHLKPSVALLRIERGRADVEIIWLE